MNEDKSYQDINAETIDRWVAEGWEWGRPISHEVYREALENRWEVLLTPTKPVPREWLGDLRGKDLLGLASGGGQLKAGFLLTDLYEDTNGEGYLHELNIPTFLATRAVKPES